MADEIRTTDETDDELDELLDEVEETPPAPDRPERPDYNRRILGLSAAVVATLAILLGGLQVLPSTIPLFGPSVAERIGTNDTRLQYLEDVVLNGPLTDRVDYVDGVTGDTTFVRGLSLLTRTKEAEDGITALNRALITVSDVADRADARSNENAAAITRLGEADAEHEKKLEQGTSARAALARRLQAAESKTAVVAAHTDSANARITAVADRADSTRQMVAALDQRASHNTARVSKLQDDLRNVAHVAAQAAGGNKEERKVAIAWLASY